MFTNYDIAKQSTEWLAGMLKDGDADTAVSQWPNQCSRWIVRRKEKGKTVEKRGKSDQQCREQSRDRGRLGGKGWGQAIEHLRITALPSLRQGVEGDT